VVDSITVVRRELDQGRNEIQEGLALIENFQIRDANDQEFAVEVLRDVKARHNELEKRRTVITKPMNQALREVNNLFRPLKDALEQGERILKLKIAKYQQEQERRNEQALLAAAEAATSEEAEEALAQTADLQSPRGINVRYVWRAVIVDEMKLPRGLLMPDMDKINAYVRQGDPTDVPGLRFEKVPIVSARK